MSDMHSLETAWGRVGCSTRGSGGMPLLFLHGDRDEVIPLMYGEALFEGAPEPKTMHVFRGVAHNDVLARAGREWVDVIARWAVQHAGS